jgi:hypothetical protein
MWIPVEGFCIPVVGMWIIAAMIRTTRRGSWIIAAMIRTTRRGSWIIAEMIRTTRRGSWIIAAMIRTATTGTLITAARVRILAAMLPPTTSMAHRSRAIAWNPRTIQPSLPRGVAVIRKKNVLPVPLNVNFGVVLALIERGERMKLTN